MRGKELRWFKQYATSDTKWLLEQAKIGHKVQSSTKTNMTARNMTARNMTARQHQLAYLEFGYDSDGNRKARKLFSL
jgi:hypothetical protein